MPQNNFPIPRMQFFDEQGENIQLDLSQKIVAIGIPSIGNVGQLAVDVLVSTMNASRIGSFDAGNLVVEMVGNDPYLSANSLAGELHTAMEGLLLENFSNGSQLVSI